MPIITRLSIRALPFYHFLACCQPTFKRHSLFWPIGFVCADCRISLIKYIMGAGVALLAAAREPLIAATVADSAWADESPQIDHMRAIGRLPVLPYEPALVDTMIGAHLADTRPLAVIGQIAPRAVLLIHSADDANTTTPLVGEQQLYAAPGNPKEQWIAPHGGHVGAINAYKDEYKQRVLNFFGQYLKSL